MNLTQTLNDLRDERSSLKERLRLVESTLRALEQLDSGILAAVSAATNPIPHRGTLKDRIQSVLKLQPETWLKPRQVADLIGGASNLSVGQLLSAMRHAGELEYSRELGYRLFASSSVPDSTGYSMDNIYVGTDNAVYTEDDLPF